ncbi:MAG: hypothetical protein LV480_05695 [Methylacidiphilales bacterium]|nr:hypothetical protein [Candidatus Methylacidiphilales bacterium]
MRTFLLPCLLLFFTAFSIHAATGVPPPVAAPAFVDVVSFEFQTENENHKVVVITSPLLLRVDEPSDGYSILYNPKTDHYTGLEHRNYTYWEFSWPEVRDAVENSKRHEARLQQLGNEGLETDVTPPSTNAPSDASTNAAPLVSDDDSGYVWHPTNEKKRIAGFDCVRWIGETVSGESVEAWCYGGLLPKVQAAVQRLHAINEPVALVPIRTLAPDFIYPVYDALAKGGVTPLLIIWGDDSDKNSFRFLEAGTRDAKPALFTVPKLYMKTTLISMDDLLKQRK